MSWQARGAGGGGGWPGGRGPSFAGSFTATGKKLAIALAACFVVEIFCRAWLGLDDLTSALYLWPIGSGRFWPWQLLTYPFVGNLDPLNLLFMVVGVFFFEPPLERYLGTGRFSSFLVITVLASAIIGMLGSYLLTSIPVPGRGVPGFATIQPLAGFGGVIAVLVVAFGWLQPQARILIFFVLPVPAIYLTYSTIFFEALALLMKQPWSFSHLAGIGFTYLVIRRGLRVPDARRHWLLFKQRGLQKKLAKLEVIQGGKSGRKDSGNGDPRKPVLH